MIEYKQIKQACYKLAGAFNIPLAKVQEEFAKATGHRDWNTLAAKQQPAPTKPRFFKLSMGEETYLAYSANDKELKLLCLVDNNQSLEVLVPAEEVTLDAPLLEQKFGEDWTCDDCHAEIKKIGLVAFIAKFAEQEAPTRSQYITGSWGHIFAEHEPERETRIAYDCETHEIVALEIMISHAWHKASPTQIADVRKDFVDTNQAPNHPEQFGLVRTSTLPSWATDSNEEPATSSPQRFYARGDVLRAAHVAVDACSKREAIRRLEAGEFDEIIDEQTSDRIAGFSWDGEFCDEDGQDIS